MPLHDLFASATCSPAARFRQSHKIAINVNYPGLPNPQALVCRLKTYLPYKTAQILKSDLAHVYLSHLVSAAVVLFTKKGSITAGSAVLITTLPCAEYCCRISILQHTLILYILFLRQSAANNSRIKHFCCRRTIWQGPGSSWSLPVLVLVEMAGGVVRALRVTGQGITVLLCSLPVSQLYRFAAAHHCVLA